jgi:hypothetical protein
MSSIVFREIYLFITICSISYNCSVHLNGNSEEKDGKSTIIGSSTEALYANTSVPDSDTLLAKERGKESFNNLAYSSGKKF